MYIITRLVSNIDAVDNKLVAKMRCLRSNESNLTFLELNEYFSHVMIL